MSFENAFYLSIQTPKLFVSTLCDQARPLPKQTAVFEIRNRRLNCTQAYRRAVKHQVETKTVFLTFLLSEIRELAVTRTLAVSTCLEAES